MRLATFLLVAVALAGCREFSPSAPIVPEPTPEVQPDPIPDLPEMTLKGPQEVTRNDAPMYKAGAIAGAVRYSFELNSGPLVLTSNDNDADRYFFTDVAGEGRVEVRVTAYNADNDALAFARRWVTSRY